MKCEICRKDKKKQEIEINMLKSELCDLQQVIKHLDLVNCKLRRKIGQLEDNWNKLRKYLIKEQARIVLENADEDEFVYTDLLNKMKKIKRGDSNE